VRAAKALPSRGSLEDRAKAVPIQKMLVLIGLMRLSGVAKARQKGLVDHNDPADFSHLKDKRKVPLTIANLVSHE
jgi:hypothetical protein